MQGRKIKHKTTGEIYSFLQFELINGITYCIVENSNGMIILYDHYAMQFVKEEPTFKTETTGTHQMKHKAESMPNLQNTVDVWACMDEDGTLNLAIENEFYKDDKIWINSFDDCIATNIDDFKQAFQGVQWEDKEPKRFRITVEPLV